jgi:hypothetical protein
MGLDNVYNLTVIQHYLEALSEIETWEDEWTKVLREPDSPRDNGIPSHSIDMPRPCIANATC